MEKIITVEEKDAALKECLDWLENAPFDYHNGNSACGVDEHCAEDALWKDEQLTKAINRP